MNRSTPGLPVHHQHAEFTQTQVHRDRDAIQPSQPLSFPSPSALKPSQHQSLFQWVNSSHEVQSTGLSALASFLPKKCQGWSPSEWTGYYPHLQMTDSKDVNLSELWELMMDREAWRAAIHGVAKNQTWLSDWTELKWTGIKFIHVVQPSPPCISEMFILQNKLCTSKTVTSHFPLPQPLFYFLPLQISLFRVPHISGIIQYLAFSDWLN